MDQIPEDHGHSEVRMSRSDERAVAIGQVVTVQVACVAKETSWAGVPILRAARLVPVVPAQLEQGARGERISPLASQSSASRSFDIDVRNFHRAGVPRAPVQLHPAVELHEAPLMQGVGRFRFRTAFARPPPFRPTVERRRRISSNTRTNETSP